MLKNISWTDYIIAVAIALIIYYIFVAVRYFSDELKGLLSEKRKLTVLSNGVPGKNNNEVVSEPGHQMESTGFADTTDDEFTEIEHLIERLKTVIEDASRRKLIPQEFKQYLGMVLKEYPSVRYSPLRSSVNELIISECEKYGAITLSESDADLLWKDVAV
jgi:hypothetical protein